MKKGLIFLTSLLLVIGLSAGGLGDPVSDALLGFSLSLGSPQTFIHIEQGAMRMVITDGASFDIESGGEVDFETGAALKLAGTAITSTAAELNILDGCTATFTELNLMDGVTSTTAELNILDGCTATFTELNLVDGCTSTTAELNYLDGGLARTNMVEDALQVYGIPIYTLRAADLAAMGVSETAGDHYLLLTTDEITLVGEISNNETETSVSWFQFVIPPEYVAAGDFKVRVKHSLFGAGTDGAGSSTIDIAAHEQDGNGATGADLSTTTAATTSTKGSWATTDFVITAAGLVAGDIINIKVTSVVAENATANLQMEIDGLAILLDIKG